MMPGDQLLTLDDAVLYCRRRWKLRISAVTLRRYIRKGALRVVRHGPGPKPRIKLRASTLECFFGSESGQ